MKPSLKFLTVPLFFLLGSIPVFAQTDAKAAAPAKQDPLPTVDQLVEKCAKANGGKEAWAKLSTMVLTGTMDVPTFNMSGKVEVYAKAPNKVLRIITLADGQFVQKQAFDGKAGWKSDLQSGLTPLSGAELEEAKAEAIFDSEVRLKEVYPDMKVTGRSKVGDRDAYAVLAHEGRKTLTFYFDAQNGMRIGQDSEGPDETGAVQKISVTFDDYRAVGGVQVAHHIRGTSPAIIFEMHIQEAQVNVPVDDAKFAMPPAAN